MDLAKIRFSHPQPRLDRWDFVTAMLLGVLVMVLTWHWRAAIVPIDPWDYVEGALNFPNGAWNEVGLSRWGMLAPLMLAGAIWGNAEITYYIYPIVAAGLLVGVLYGLAARLANRWTGVAGSLLVSLTALVFVHLSRGYPDLIALAFVGLALFSLLMARDAMTESPRLGSAWILLAGCAVGWAFTVRELTIFAWPALAIALIRVGRPRLALPAFAVPPLIALAADTYLNSRVFDDPWLRFNLLTGNSIASSGVSADAVYLGHDRWYYMSIPIRILWERSAGPALVLTLGVGLVGGAWRMRQLGALWLWGASVFSLLWISGGLLRPSAPSIRLDIIRYNLAFAVPLALTGVCVLGLLIMRSRGRPRVVASVCAAVLAFGSVIPTARFVATFEGLAPNGGDSMREMDEFLQTYPGLENIQIWSDWATQRIIPIYSVGVLGGRHWESGNIRSLNRLFRPPTPPLRRWPQAGDLVVQYSQDDQTCYHCHEALAEVEAKIGPLPLPGWQEVFRARANNLKVFRIPPAPYLGPPVLTSGRTNGLQQERGNVDYLG